MLRGALLASALLGLVSGVRGISDQEVWAWRWCEQEASVAVQKCRRRSGEESEAREKANGPPKKKKDDEKQSNIAEKTRTRQQTRARRKGQE